MNQQPPPRAINITIGEIRSGQVVRATILVVAVLLLFYFLQQLLSLAFLLFVAAMLATAIEPIVNRLRRGVFSRTTGILVVYTGLFAVIVAVAWLAIPVILAQAGDFVKQMPDVIASIRKTGAETHSTFIQSQTDALATALGQIFVSPPTVPASPDQSVQQVQQTTTVVLTAAESFFSVLAIFVIAFYWMTERTLIKRWTMSLLPADQANRARRIWDDIEVKVGGWVRGQLLLMTIVGLVSAGGYFLLGLKYWPVLAVLIFLCEAIPLVGPYLGTAPALVVALTQTGNEGLPGLLGGPDFGPLPRVIAVVVFAVILQTLEGNVLVPRVMRNSVGISPLTVMVSLLIGATLAGLVGAALAVPLAGALQVIVADWHAATIGDSALPTQAAPAESAQAAGGPVVAHPAGDGTQTEVVSPGDSRPQ